MKSIGAVGVGKSLFVYKYGDIDISLPRTEKKVGVLHNSFEVSVTQDEQEASSRRDFTLNAMMINIFNGEFLDFHNGLENLRDGVLKYVDKDKFCEDSLRVLRAVQFCARFGFEIEPKTLELMNSLELSNLSKTRIFWELEKLFLGTYFRQSLLYMYKLNLFEKLFLTRVEFNQVESLISFLEQNVDFFEADLRRFCWLYFAYNFLGLNIENIELPKMYKKRVHVPFLTGEISDSELKMVAFERPLNEWVGVCQKGLRQRAVELGIYERKYTGGVKIEDVINDGFKNEEIGIEFKKRVMNTL